MEDLEALIARAAGFGRCRSCEFFQGGSPRLCSACARRTLDEVTLSEGRCRICDLPFNASEDACRNPVCNMSDRGFEWNWSIAMRTGVLKDAINAYKFRDQRWWAWIFGRIVVGFLDAHHDPFDEMDLIIPSPGFVGPGGRRSWDFIRQVLVIAQREQDPPGWPFHLDDPQAIVKTAETERLSSLGSYQAQRSYAEGSLYDALQVPQPSLVKGRRIVVFDDIFTNGLTQRAVAQRLREAGASHVYGLTLARQPWGGGKATD